MTKIVESNVDSDAHPRSYAHAAGAAATTHETINAINVPKSMCTNRAQFAIPFSN